MTEIIKHLFQFIVDLWQIHSFREVKLYYCGILDKVSPHNGISATNDMFKDHSWFFSNALVRSQYENIPQGVHRTFEPLESFMNFAAFGITADLRNRTLQIRWNETKYQNDV